jgi:hypothetical protein
MVLCQVSTKAQDFAIVHVMNGARHDNNVPLLLLPGWFLDCGGC